ncbi:MAG: recombinase family protein [Caulobacteraceae bacterium]
MKPRQRDGKPTALRCAVYTRKSTEEGLDQAYNSLHAQRDACEAYVRSQTGEGWTLLKTAYDDGGFSGGNMDRPGLKQLLVDVARGAVDVIVVYKVDRLTRSLMDFAKIVEVLDGQGVSFVSVTQAFNTTTSMGRLTLNVLLSFAQFEREVTGERIRDKIAASKAKGIWMGGTVPLGYDAVDRNLLVNEAEAEVVRGIFRRYLELRSMPALVEELEEQGLRSKSWTTRKGVLTGGVRFSVGGLSYVLKNQLYIGKIVHKAEVHAGLHPPIVDNELFEAVQAQRAANRWVRSARPTRAAKSPLTGKIFDAEGSAMSPAFCYSRKKQIYRYYVSPAVLPGRRRKDVSPKGVRRVAAIALEELVIEKIQQLTARSSLDWEVVRGMLESVVVGSEGIEIGVRIASQRGARVPSIETLRERLGGNDVVDLEASPGEGMARIFLPIRPVFRGGRTWLNAEAAEAARPRAVSKVLMEGLKRSHRLLAALRASPLGDADDMRTASAPTNFHDRRMAALGFLAPEIQQSILDGRQPAKLTMTKLLDGGVPLCWAEQRGLFGISG